MFWKIDLMRAVVDKKRSEVCQTWSMCCPLAKLGNVLEGGLDRGRTG
jgi:hypothetical protein